MCGHPPAVYVSITKTMHIRLHALCKNQYQLSAYGIITPASFMKVMCGITKCNRVEMDRKGSSDTLFKTDASDLPSLFDEQPTRRISEH